MFSPFLREPVAAANAARFGVAVPCATHTVLTDNGIEHRLTRASHPWTNKQVERMNRTPKDATMRRHHRASHDEPRIRVQLFRGACNHARRLKALRGLTPYQFNCRA